MKLRSGRNTELCGECNKFYAHKSFGYMCSECCPTFVPKSYYPMYNSIFRQQLDDWASERLVFSRDLYKMLKSGIKNTDFSSKTSILKFQIYVYTIRADFKESDSPCYISAKHAAKLLRKVGVDCVCKSHIICPLVLDWWNMKTHRYTSYELCYFGRYGEAQYYIKSLPPPKPEEPFFDISSSICLN